MTFLFISYINQILSQHIFKILGIILKLQHLLYIVAGFAGRALLFLRQYNTRKDVSYLSVASQYIDAALNIINKTPKCPSYFAGLSGVYIVAVQVANISNR